MPINSTGKTPGAQPRRGRAATALAALDECWAVPTDTYISGDLPLLLTKLSNLPPVRGRKD